MKVDKLICKSQPSNWLQTITNECLSYPIQGMILNKEDLVVDVGANVGGFANAWGHISNNWYLVEPSKYNQEEIEKNLEGFNYKLFKNAVGDVSGKILKLQKFMNPSEESPSIDTPSGNMGVSGWTDKNNNHGWQGDYEEVESISFKDLIGEREVGLLKVDCEGSEYEFLMNCDLANIKYIVMELHNFLGQHKQKELCAWIEKTHNEVFSTGGQVISSSYSDDDPAKYNHHLKVWANV